MARSLKPGGSGRVQKQPVLPDVLETGMVTVFCGHAAGTRSAEKREYYAHPRNKFWEVLWKIKLTRQQFKPCEYPKLAELRIGLTVLNNIQSGGIKKLSPEYDDIDGLCQKIEEFCPEILAFVGKKPAQVFLEAKFRVKDEDEDVDYGLQPERYRLGRTELFVLPSTSSRNVHWHPKRSGPRYERLWLELAKRHGELLAEE